MARRIRSISSFSGSDRQFDKMYPDVSEAGIVFTAIGIVTSDPASVESVLAWAAHLQRRTAYLIVENSASEHTDFTYWRESEQALRFQKIFSPPVIQMDYRLPDLENATRNHGAMGPRGQRLGRSDILLSKRSYMGVNAMITRGKRPPKVEKLVDGCVVASF